MDDNTKISTIAILKSALHNAGVVQDQLTSLRDDYDVQFIEEQLQETIDAIQAELDSLDAR